MKKLIFSSAVLILLSLVSCGKQCYECKTVTTATASGIAPQVSTTTFTVCGNPRESEGRVESTSVTNGITIKVVAITTCD